MSKVSELVKKTGVIGIGTFGTKAITFLLLPLYTNILAPDDYGLIDVMMTISWLLLPFIALEINSGVFRFMIDLKGKNYTHEEVISTGVAIEVIGLSIALFISIAIYCFVYIPYYAPLVFYILSLATSRLSLDIVRGFGKTITYSVTNLIITSVALSLNLILILFFHWGAVAILVATAIGNFSGVLYLFGKEKIYNHLSISKINRALRKDILCYTFPLIPNTISWWVSSASDRLIILFFLDISANGIYAAANKIPGIYTTIFSVFGLAWTEMVARNASDNIFIEHTVKASVSVMLYALIGLIACTSLFFDYIIGVDYIDSYWHIFILLIATFFSCCSSLYGGVFTGKMRSKELALTTFIGAAVNIVMNLIMIKFIGLYAASLSTLCAYILISFIRKKQVQNWYNINNFTTKDLIFIPIFLICVVGYYLHDFRINIITIVSVIICIWTLYGKGIHIADKTAR